MSKVVQLESRNDLPALLEARNTALTSSEVCELLAISKTMLCGMTTARRIPHYRLGASLRYDPAHLAAWLRERTIGLKAA